MKNAAAYRADARKTLENQIFGNTWMMTALVLLLVNTALAVVCFTVVGTILLIGPLYTGLAIYILQLTRRNGIRNDITVLLHGFRGDVSNTILLGFVRTLFVFLWSLLLIVPGVIKALSYSMAYYIRADHPEYTATECLTESTRLMQGHKWRLFCLYLSFLGWAIVGALCFGIGIVWVNAYVETAKAHFYEDLPKPVGRSQASF